MSDSDFDNRSLASDVTRFTSRSRGEPQAQEDEESLSDDPIGEETYVPVSDTQTRETPEESLSDDQVPIQPQIDDLIDQSPTSSLSDDPVPEQAENDEEEPSSVEKEALVTTDFQGGSDVEESTNVGKEVEESESKGVSEESGDDVMRMPVDQEETLRDNLEQSMTTERWKDSSVRNILKSKKRTLILYNYWSLLVPSNKVQLSMSDLCFTFTNSIYNAKRNSLSLKFTDPKALLTLFENGDLFVSGCKNKEAMFQSTRLILKALSDHAEIKTMDYREPMCLNIVGSMGLDLTKVDPPLLNASKTMLDFSSLKSRLNSIAEKTSSLAEIEIPLFTFAYEKPGRVIGFSFNVLEPENSFVKFGIILISASGYISMYVQFPNYRICFVDEVEKVYLFVVNRLLNALENKEEEAIEKAKSSVDEVEPVLVFNLDDKGALIPV